MGLPGASHREAAALVPRPHKTKTRLRSQAGFFIAYLRKDLILSRWQSRHKSLSALDGSGSNGSSVMSAPHFAHFQFPLNICFWKPPPLF